MTQDEVEISEAPYQENGKKVVGFFTFFFEVDLFHAPNAPVYEYEYS